MSKFGLPCAFLVKVIPIDFQLGKCNPVKEKDVSIFFLQYSTGRRFRYAHGDLGFSLKLFQIAAEA